MPLFQSALHFRFWVQPLFYAFHGWLATEMAIWMLFHPYEPQYIPGTKLQLPFTPGIFPRGRYKLSKAIADTITDILLTKEDIKVQARKLITEENLYKALDAFLDSIMTEITKIHNLRRLYHHVDNLAPTFVQKLTYQAIEDWKAGDTRHIQNLVDIFITKGLPALPVTEEMAAQWTSVLFTNVLTPERIRRNLTAILTKDNAKLLETTLRKRIGGLQGLLLRFIDIEKGFTALSIFLIEHPEEGDGLIGQLMKELEMERKLKEKVLAFAPQQLSVATLDAWKGTLTQVVVETAITHQDGIAQIAYDLSKAAAHGVTATVLSMDVQQHLEKLLPDLKRDLAHLLYTYLNQDLESLVSQALPAISLNTVIVEKIDQFSAQELEMTIQGICHRELRWLAILGAILGFWLGMLSNFINFILH